MYQPGTKERISDNPAEMKRPGVELMSAQQWRYVQRRFKITPRELQVAKLICRGMGNNEIAGCLNITTGTVKVHIRNLYRKTWAENKILMLLRFIEDSSTLFGKPPR